MYIMSKNKNKEYETLTILRPHPNRLHSMREFGGWFKENALRNYLLSIPSYCNVWKDQFCICHTITRQKDTKHCRRVNASGILLNRPTYKIVYRSRLSAYIPSYKRIANKSGMHNANNKSLEPWKFQSRKANSDYREYDKQTFDSKRRVMATVRSSQCLCHEYVCVNGVTGTISIQISIR